MRRVLYKQKSFDFFQKRTIVLIDFESYLSFLKSPEFRIWGVQNMLTTHLLLHSELSTQPLPSFKETTLLHQIRCYAALVFNSKGSMQN